MKILKSTWYWPILIVSVCVLMLYLGYTGHRELTMRQIWSGLGQPDPWLMLMLCFLTGVSFWFSAINIGQNKSTEIISEVGRISTHSQYPVALFDPLDNYNYEPIEEDIIAKCKEEGWGVGSSECRRWRKKHAEELRAKLEQKRLGFYKYEHYISEDEIKQILKDKEWKKDSFEFQRFLTKYKRQIHAMLPKGAWPDGGIRFLQMEGGRFITGGPSSIMAGSPEFMLKHGDGAVCLGAAECFLYGEQIQKIPREILGFVKEHFPWFYFGKHTLAYYTEPHPKAVRAFVRANKDVKDDEVMERPRWVYTLALERGEEIDYEKRTAYLTKIRDEVQDELDKNNSLLTDWEERERRKKEEKVEPEMADNNEEVH